MSEEMGIFSEGALDAFRKKNPAGVRKKPTREVCACGHSMNFHKPLGEKVYCSPGRGGCLCEEPSPVLEAESTRVFMYVTTGFGSEHALAKGILASIDKGFGFKWIDGDAPKCAKCAGDAVNPYPVAARVVEDPSGSARLVPTAAPGVYNKILCASCFSQI